MSALHLQACCRASLRDVVSCSSQLSVDAHGQLFDTGALPLAERLLGFLAPEDSTGIRMHLWDPPRFCFCINCLPGLSKKTTVQYCLRATLV